MRQTGANERDRELALHRLVEGCDQRLKLERREELDLVDQENNAAALLSRRLAEREQEVGQVIVELPAVRVRVITQTSPDPITGIPQV